MAAGKTGTLTWTSGSFSVRVTWSETYELLTNKSNVTISKLEVKSTSYSNASYYPDGKIKINGTVVKTMDSRIPTGEVDIVAKNTWYTISNSSCSLSNIAHNNDGSKSINIELAGNRYDAFEFYTTYGSAGSGWGVSGAKQIALTTIPRASSFTVEGNTIGREMTVNVTRHSESFKHTLWYKMGDSEWYVVSDDIDTSITFTPTIELCYQIPNSEYGVLQLCLRTMNGTTQIGSDVYKNIDAYVYIPDMKPVITSRSIEIDNSSNSVLNNWGVCVAGYSKIRILSTAEGAYGATINKFNITDGYNDVVAGQSLDYTGSVLSSGDKSFYIMANDTRGLSSELVLAGSVYVHPYEKPYISKFSVYRSEENAKHVKITSAYSYDSIDDNNTISSKLYYKKYTDNTWTSYDEDIALGEDIELNFDFDETSSYNFKLIITDALDNSSESEAFISTLEVLMDFRAGGKGLGIGKIAESDALEVALQAKFLSELLVKNDENTYLNVLQELLKLNNNISTIQSNSVLKSDFIMEQGTIDVWTYRKWASGIVELWGYVSMESQGRDVAITREYSLPFNIISFISVNVSPVYNAWAIDRCYLNQQSGMSDINSVNLCYYTTEGTNRVYEFSIQIVARYDTEITQEVIDNTPTDDTEE